MIAPRFRSDTYLPPPPRSPCPLSLTLPPPCRQGGVVIIAVSLPLLIQSSTEVRASPAQKKATARRNQRPPPRGSPAALHPAPQRRRAAGPPYPVKPEPPLFFDESVLFSLSPFSLCFRAPHLHRTHAHARIRRRTLHTAAAAASSPLLLLARPGSTLCGASPAAPHAPLTS